MVNKIDLVLKDLNIDKDNFKNLYILKLGGICFSTLPDENETLYPVSAYEETIKEMDNKDFNNEDLENEINEALKQHKNIFGIEKLSNDDYSYSRSHLELFIYKGNIYKLKVNLPSRFQKYGDLNSKDIEEFMVLYSGSAFCSYSKINEFPIFTHIAHEFREILKEQIDEKTQYFNHIIGPSPLHTDIYIVHLVNNDKEKNIIIKKKKMIFFLLLVMIHLILINLFMLYLIKSKKPLMIFIY